MQLIQLPPSQSPLCTGAALLKVTLATSFFTTLAYFFKHTGHLKFSLQSTECHPPKPNCTLFMRYVIESHSSISCWGAISKQITTHAYHEDRLETVIEKKSYSTLFGPTKESSCVHDILQDKKSCVTTKRNKIFPESILQECLTTNATTLAREQCRNYPDGERYLLTSLEELHNHIRSEKETLK